VARTNPTKPLFGLYGRGNNGAVLQGPDLTVYKWTIDPVEIQAFLAQQALANSRYLLRGHDPLPQVYDIRIGHRAAVIHRESVPSAGSLLDPSVVDGLRRAARLETAGRMTGQRQLVYWGRRTRQAAAAGNRPLHNLLRSLRRFRPFQLHMPDLQPPNLGVRRGQLVLRDPGRTPTETLLVSHGEAARRCPNEKALRGAVRDILGTAPSYSTCQVVSINGLRRIMRQHGWRDAEIDGTAGFHGEDGVISLREGDEWSQLHEQVHAAGIVDQGLAPWLTEGLTEAVAQEIARSKGLKHHPTYPTEVRAVKTKLAPMLGTTVLDLGKQVTAACRANKRQQACQQIGRTLAQQLQDRTGVRATSWYKTIGPGAMGREQFMKLAGSVKSKRRSA